MATYTSSKVKSLVTVHSVRSANARLMEAGRTGETLPPPRISSDAAMRIKSADEAGRLAMREAATRFQSGR